MMFIFFNILIMIYYYTIEYIVTFFSPAITESIDIEYIVINMIISYLLTSISLKKLSKYIYL